MRIYLVFPNVMRPISACSHTFDISQDACAAPNVDLLLLMWQGSCRFSNWTSKECRIQECVEAHTNVDIVVDLEQLKSMLDVRLPLVFAGASVFKTDSVWPSSDPHGPQPWTTLPGK
jgi:hypothetical protein